MAFIADGNRRWMKNRCINFQKENRETTKIEFGVRKIQEFVALAYFYDLKEVSFYCLSINNLKRSKDEMDAMMNYIKSKKLLDLKIPLKIQIYGELDRFDDGVRAVFEKLMKDGEPDGSDVSNETNTSNAANVHDRLKVNIFFGYSSSEDEKNEKKFSGKIDLLIRTGGERRISDFLVKNVASGTSVDFLTPFWPEFSWIHLVLSLVKFNLEERYLSK